MTLDAKDEYTRGHSHRVAEYAALIASELGWKKEDIRHLKLATHLHDIGKIGIPDSILNKPTRLTPEEYNVIKEHTVIGAENEEPR
ncbi:MAG: HD domain-containing protein [Thermoflexaceae bacterium]|uniref:HD-GYP domain-containing protein n=1 Tax=Faecalicatena contorta TaxID=39482 RepID=UPI001F2AF6C5|nr:HD domain-containing phosphohydrolase [Faecalicatena contorta]MDD6571645.1 HD domain-containing protein [Thermoflexaceae bacterium]